MEKEIISQSFSQGLWATLFVFLLITVIGLVKWILQKFEEREKVSQAENNEREKRYIGTIDTLASGLNNIKEVKACVDEMRKDVAESNRRQETMIGRVLDKLPAKGE